MEIREGGTFGKQAVLKEQFEKADQIAFEQKAISIWKVMQFFLF